MSNENDRVIIVGAGPVGLTAALTLHRRLTLIAQDGAIVKVFYPIFPPDQHAADVVAWLAGRAA